MYITNADFDALSFDYNDLFVFTIGYEQRSYYIYDRIIEKIPCAMLDQLIFVFDDYQEYEHTRTKLKEIREKNPEIHLEKYCDFRQVHDVIVQKVSRMIEQSESITVHIDYSSMPRSWYCMLPILLNRIIRDKDRVYFWYSEGKYPPVYQEFPSAGIDTFSHFSGKASLQIESNRIHIFGLGFDAIRTQAIMSITDPDYLVSCYAYNPKTVNLLNYISETNSTILSRSAITIALHIDDFSYMVSKLRELTNEMLSIGDVVLIPDGPKPLIMAISLIPDIIKKNGVTCLHVSRNCNHFTPVEVSAAGSIFGFTLQKKITSV